MSDFDHYSKSYERAVEDSVSFSGLEHAFFNRMKVRELVRLARNHLGDPAACDALDVGCGVGLIARGLAASFRRVIGLDPSPASVDEARAAGGGVEYVHFDGRVIPHDAGSFDFVYAVNVLHHVVPNERDALVTEMARVLRPGGLAAVIEHNPLNPLTRLAVARCPFDEDAVLLTRGEVARLVRDAGLRRIEARYVLFFPFDAEAFRAVERVLAPLPFGAQHLVAARKPGS